MSEDSTTGTTEMSEDNHRGMFLLPYKSRHFLRGQEGVRQNPSDGGPMAGVPKGEGRNTVDISGHE